MTILLVFELGNINAKVMYFSNESALFKGKPSIFTFILLHALNWSNKLFYAQLLYWLIHSLVETVVCLEKSCDFILIQSIGSNFWLIQSITFTIACFRLMVTKFITRSRSLCFFFLLVYHIMMVFVILNVYVIDTHIRYYIDEIGKIEGWATMNYRQPYETDLMKR